MASVPTPVITSAGLIGGFVVARGTKRAIGGAVLAAAGVGAFETWRRQTGPGTACGLTAGYLVAFGLSHPLAKKMGAWPSVLTVTAATGAAAYALGDRRAE